MKRLFAFLSTAAICAAVSATPAAAQVVSNPGNLHHRTHHMQRHHSALGQRYGYRAEDVAPSALVPHDEHGCGVDWWVTADHYTRPITLCGLF
jgi:hypothetical protein